MKGLDTTDASNVHLNAAKTSLLVVPPQKTLHFLSRPIAHLKQQCKILYYVFQQNNFHAIILYFLCVGSTVSLWAIKYFGANTFHNRGNKTWDEYQNGFSWIFTSAVPSSSRAQREENHTNNCKVIGTKLAILRHAPFPRQNRTRKGRRLEIFAR